jgi:four helix bundle protein
MHDYRKLKAWQRSHVLVLDIYNATRSFPRNERYGLTAQLRRAAASIPINIAEGSGSGTDLNFARYLQASIASSTELEYELSLSRDLGYISPERHSALGQELGEIRGMLTALSVRLRKS